MIMSPHFRNLIVQIMAAVLTFVRPSIAQTNAGTIEGFARVATTNAPMPFSLVRLLRSDSASSPSLQTITNADGRFRIASLPAGDFRLQILRIGFHPMVSPLLHLESGETLHYELRSEPLPVQLPTVAVHAFTGCLGAANIADDSALALLWNEARKGVEVRRAFELRYRFSRSLHQVAQVHWRLRPDRHQVRVDTVASEPDSIPVREVRAQTEHAGAGYGQGNRLIIPDEKELLDGGFLRNNCLETSIERKAGAIGVAFRPASLQPTGYAIRGTIWLDSASYLIRWIDYGHLDDGEAFSQVSINYAPVRVGESVLQLPSGGQASLRPRGPGHWLASAVTATLSYTYWGFQEVPQK